MSRRLRLLTVGLVLVTILAQVLGLPRQADLLYAAPSGAAGRDDERERERARGVPREAEARDRLRAGQASRAPLRGPAPLAASAEATSTVVKTTKFGFGVADVTTGRGTTLEKADQAGAGWMMGWVSWQNVEPSRGAFTWQSSMSNDLDNVAGGGQSYGLKVLARIQSPPGWATYDGSGRLSQVNPDDLRRSMEALARRGAGRVAAYQVFNEPNLNYEWGADTVDAAAAARYAVLLNAAYTGLKAGDPSAVVVSAGLANGSTAPSMDDLTYLREFYRAGAKGSFDALGTHPYGGNQPPESTTCNGTCFRRPEQQRLIMEEFGDATPMWATEVGWLHESSYDLGQHFNGQKVTAQQQADYLVRAFQFAEANWSWMGPMFVFNHDHSTAMWCGGPCYPVTTSVHWFSVLNPDRTPRPAYTALQNMPKDVVTPAPTPTSTRTPTRTSTPTHTPTATRTPTVTRTPVAGIPSAPTNLSGVRTSGSQINLSWSDQSINETGFRIERCQGATCTSFSQVTTLGPNATSYQNSGLRSNRTYRYRVRANGSAGNSSYSNIITCDTQIGAACRSP